MDRTYIIERESPIPIYHQIASDLLTRISLGEWKVGEKLPSEAEMRSEYDVSAITLRQALKQLEDSHLIVRHQGRGSFLCDTPKPFIEDLSLPGTNTPGISPNTSKLIELRQEKKLSFALRQAFDVDESGPFIFLRRIFLRQNKILGLNDVWFPEAYVPGLLEEGLIQGSIGTTLQQRYGYQIADIENYIETAKLNAMESSLLEASYDAPALRILSAHRAQNGRIVEYSVTSWVGNLTRFHIKVDVPHQHIEG